MFEKEREHPAYGMISFNRITGGSGGKDKFFGSHMDCQNWIELRINKGSVCHNLGRNWYHAGGELISVRITHNQFVNLITTMNSSPTPCTVEHILGKRTPPMPESEMTEAQESNLAFKQQMQDFMEKLSDYRTKVYEITAKKRTTRSDLNDLKDMMSHVFTEVQSNMPFYLESFEKSAGKVVVEAKQEVEAFTNDIIRNAGMEAIARGEFPKMLE